MYQAGVDFGTISLTPILHGVVATVLYFLVGAAVLVAGFLMVNLLTPGDLRRLVFIDRRPNAVVLAATMYVALAIVTIAAIYASSNQLAQGLIGVAVYGIVGVALQGVALVILEIAVPGRFREHIDAPAHLGHGATASVVTTGSGIAAGCYGCAACPFDRRHRRAGGTDSQWCQRVVAGGVAPLAVQTTADEDDFAERIVVVWGGNGQTIAPE